jgi:outer membrane receptor protein involved in Fe transport
MTIDKRPALRRKTLCLAVAGLLGTLAGGQTLAQDDEVIVVTGTRIRTPGFASNSPIQSVTAQDLEIVQPTALEEFFRKLPGAIPAIGPGTNNGSNGGASIDLRGLGSNRNVVLVDGRRLTPADLDGRTDTNFIPLALIERVDIITGGASAVYGADAVSGAVNVILRRDFEGVELSGNYGEALDEGDASRQNYEVTLGSNLADGRGNVAVSIGRTRVDPLRQDSRDIGRFSLSSTTGAVQGSGTATPVVLNNIIAGTQLDLRTGSPTAGTFVPIYNFYNFQPDNFYQTALDRYQATAIGRYEVTDRMEVYSNLMYTRADVFAQIAPSGSFLNNYAVPIGNPFLPAAARTQLCTAAAIAPANCVVGNPTEITMSLGRRFEELGPRMQNFENNAFQLTMGVRGDITDTWSYDTYWSYGEGEQTRTRDNWGSLSRLQQALRALNPNTCTNTANGCVPFNIFGPIGSITQPMLNFVNLDAITRTNVDQKVFEGSVSGDLGDAGLPWTDQPIGLAFGIEHRRMGAANASDGSSQLQGEVLGTGAPTPDRSGTIRLQELFAEMLLPIVSDKTGVRALDLELGVRRTDFEVSGGSDSKLYNSYKAGLAWAPVDQLRVRLMRQRATRSPNVNELFEPIVSGLSNLAVDPCQLALINQAQANTPGTLSNLCRLTGVPLATIGTLPAPSAGQINVRTGGNPRLGPEKADTETLGFVWTPNFADNLAITIDYYKIEINDAVSSPTAPEILNDCYSAAANPGFVFNSQCALVLRDPVTGTFNGATAPGVVRALSNVGYYETDGYDLGATYRFAFENARLGDLSIAFHANFVESWVFKSTPAAAPRDCLGYYSVACDTATNLTSGPRPETVWTQTTRWAFGKWDVALTWRNISELIEEPGGATFLPAFMQIPEYDYFDIGAGWDATEKLRVSLTMLNATDEDAPNVGQTIGGTSNNSGNTYPQSYDAIGRFLTLGFEMRF